MPTTEEVNTAAANFIADTDTADAKINGLSGDVTDRHGVTTPNLEKILGGVQGYALGAAGWRDFADVSGLLNDSTLTYTPSLPETVVAGDIIRTRSEGFAYKVAASGATDHHLTTAGGVKLYVEQSAVFDPVDVRALGVIQGDSSTPIMTSNVDIIQAQKDNFQALYFPGGDFYFNAGIDLANKSSFAVIGAGKNSTRLRFVGTLDYGLRIGNHAGSYQTQFQVRGLQFIGSIATDNAGFATDVYAVDKMIYQGGLANQVIYEDLDILYATYGIHSFDTPNNWNRTFREVSMRYVGTGIYSAEANGNTLERVDIYDFQNTGIHITGFGIRIQGCSLEVTIGPPSPLGVYFYGYGFEIVGNYFEGVLNAISIDGSAATPSRSGVIKGNYMVGLSGASGSYAVSLVVATAIEISGNWFRDFDIGVRSDSSSTYNVILDPNFYDVNTEVQNGYGCHRIGQDGVFDFSGSPYMEIKARDRNLSRGTVLRTDWSTVNGVIDLYLNDGVFAAASNIIAGTDLIPSAGSSHSLGSANNEWANVVTDQIQMRSPNGSLWTITVNDSGTLVVV